MNKSDIFPMTRRRFIGASSILLLPVVGGISFSACQGGKDSKYYSQFAFILAYLLFGENPPRAEQEKIKQALQETAAESLQIEVNLREVFDKVSTVWTLQMEAREEYFQSIMPRISESPEIFMVLTRYFEENRILSYLDYPALPGDYGSCGYLVQDGEIWNRYYPK